jgi:hypothetical protein
VSRARRIFTALIYTMVLVSAADRDMTDAELLTIGEMVNYLPIFREYDTDQLTEVAQDCAKLLGDADGLEKAFALIKPPPRDDPLRAGAGPACRRRHRAQRPRPPHGVVAPPRHSPPGG